MSATRDKTQRFTFVFNNIYNVYLKTKPGVNLNKPVLKAEELVATRPNSSGLAASLNSASQNLSPVKSSAPLVSEATKSAAVPHLALTNLKRDLSQLQEIQGKMRFLLQELEEMMRDE